MASFSLPCLKTTPRCTLSQHHHHHHTALPFQSALLARSSLRFQGSRHGQSDAIKVFPQLNEVVVMESSNNAPVVETKSEDPVKESAVQNTTPDASSVSAFMTHVADIVKLVDSRDISELQLKQLGCELIIRKKEALQQLANTAPTVMMQPLSPQVIVPSQLPPAQVAAPAPASHVPSSTVSPAAPSSPAKPKSSHPPLKCPMAGTFYRSPAPGTPPFVKVGDKVQKGQVVCIIEAMKLMNDIEADQSGTVTEILVDDGKSVSVDMPLFVVEP
ncbi:biotin carboxyl carrier protein of acetyl-CoA carboxylase 2, chloroplastic-like [Diospyros lotus]|uniref:biotin carboxyl carrier protein of acetyl-CoA carboxylase 2, chloroplastic-like n=1 Tax=Diospyros lotus TaxID=55363 RepID=UPI00225B4305|nr:biotin carboxyl carrier protein of acetyl-CoA carboxylase 2, chloroplastic-like [Diospyros lotus]